MPLTVDIQKQLDGFRLEVAFTCDGDTLALLGPSGCGKSMTLRAIAGVITPDEGKIILNGRTLFDSAAHIDLPPQQRRVGLLFQNYALFPHLTVEQNLRTVLRREKDRKVRDAMFHDVMERFQLTGLEGRRPSQLSGGQQQRAALARILLSRPELLMLDEPFSALDSHLRRQMETEMASVIRRFGGDTLLVSHDREEVRRLADRIAVYHQGKIDTIQETGALFRDPVTYTGALLTGCVNLAPARVEPSGIRVDDWGLTLSAPLPHRPVSWAAIQPHLLERAAQPGENVFSYQVIGREQGPFSTRLTLRTPGGAPLQWDVERSLGENLPEEGLARIPPEHLLLLSP